MRALVRFANEAAANTFTTSHLHAPAAEALGYTLSRYPLSALRYDPLKLRAKSLVDKIPSSRRYRLRPQRLLHLRALLKTFRAHIPSPGCRSASTIPSRH